jgi:hypothetical protein
MTPLIEPDGMDVRADRHPRITLLQTFHSADLAFIAGSTIPVISAPILTGLTSGGAA